MAGGPAGAAGGSAVSRIVSRSPPGAALRRRGRASAGKEEALGEQLGVLLGVRATYEVEENEFMRDKFAHMSTFGLAGRRGISEGWHLAETTLGTVWKHRVLMISMSSVVLFTKKKSLAPSGRSDDGAASSGASEAASEPMAASSLDAIRTSKSSELIARADELLTAIPMEDISSANRFTDPRGSNDPIVQIRTTGVTGIVRNFLLRCSSHQHMENLMIDLVAALRAYRAAMDALRDGLITEDGQDGMRAFTLAVVAREEADGSETVLCRGPQLQQEIGVDGISVATPLKLYLVGPLNRVFCAKIVPYQLKVAADNSSSKAGKTPRVRADPICWSGPADDSKPKPLGVGIFVTLRDPKETAVAQEVQSVAAAGFDRRLEFAIKETSLVALTCMAVAALLVLPEWCFTRSAILTMSALPIAALMLAVRAKQGHQAVLQKSSAAAEATPNQERLSCRLQVVLVSEDRDEALMNPEETLSSYLERISPERRDSAIAAADAFGGGATGANRTPASQWEYPVDELISALSGAHDTNLQDSQCPQKWYDATDGDAKDAVRQWRESLAWRREFEVDQVLSRPLPQFFKIKKLFPHAWLGFDRDGHLVTLEQFGNVRRNVTDLKAAGVTPEDFAAHCVFLNEYWIKNKLTKTGRLNKIVDLKGGGYSQIVRDVISFFQPMNHAMQQYPELIVKIHLINVPSSFRILWKIVSAFLAKKTTEKITVVGGNEKMVFDHLHSAFPKDILPVEYGGTMDKPFREIPLEKDPADYIRRLNKNCGVPSEGDWSPLPEDWVPGSPPLRPSAAGSSRFLTAAVAGVAASSTADEHEVLLNNLVGNWVGDLSSSESMDPVLELQGVNWVKRKAAAALTPSQAIQITGRETRTILIITKTGPVTSKATGEINGAPSRLDGMGSGVQETVQVLVTSAPPELAARGASQCVQLRFTLANGDSRVVSHTFADLNNDCNTKLMAIKYTRAKDSKTATVVLVSHRKTD